jgi:HAD superfamily hydrolase (TIGR01509 family)
MLYKDSGAGVTVCDSIPQSLPTGRQAHLESAMLFVNGKQIKGVIFDIDGTLVDTFPAFTWVFNKGISQFDLEPVSQQFLVQSLRKGVNLEDLLRKIFPLPTDESLIERCQREILQHFLKIEASEVKPFPGINELFGNLKERGIKIGIATGRMSMPEKEWDRFKRWGLERLIDSIVTSREVASRKPAPDAIVECAKRMNVPIEKCLVVGDTEDDVIAARKAGGIPVAMLAGEDHLDISESEQPEFVFENLVELTLFLEKQEKKWAESV